MAAEQFAGLLVTCSIIGSSGRLGVSILFCKMLGYLIEEVLAIDEPFKFPFIVDQCDKRSLTAQHRLIARVSRGPRSVHKLGGVAIIKDVTYILVDPLDVEPFGMLPCVLVRQVLPFLRILRVLLPDAAVLTEPLDEGDSFILWERYG